MVVPLQQTINCEKVEVVSLKGGGAVALEKDDFFSAISVAGGAEEESEVIHLTAGTREKNAAVFAE